MSVLDSRVNVSLDWFSRRTEDMLFAKMIPGYNGGGNSWVNQGSMKNTGVELTVNAFPVRNNDLTWESILTAAFVKNEILDMAGEDDILTDSYSDIGGAMQIRKVGYPVGTFFVYQWEGFDDTGCNLYRKADGSLTTLPEGDDRVVRGQSNPKWTIGWNNTINWKNWTANIFIYGATGFDRLDMTRFVNASMFGTGRFFTLREAYFEGWDKVTNKANAKYSSFTNGNNRTFANSTFWLEDASFLKVKNVSIAYRVPRSVLKYLDAQVGLSVQNLCTFTKYKGIDPEPYNAGSGLDRGAYPVPRTFTLDLKFNF